MPEIGYWKYVRFVDDEKQYWGTDDDITIVFDSADDRLEYRMKKDIRFEDDAGNEILTLDKANRHVEIPVQLNVAALEEYAAGAGITVKGSLMFSGADLDLAGNLLKNPKMGSHLKMNGYHIVHGVSNAEYIRVCGGLGTDPSQGATIDIYGVEKLYNEGQLVLRTGRVAHSNAMLRFITCTTALVEKDRIVINYGDTPDIDIRNSKLDFHDQTLEATAGAIAGYFRLKVGGTEYKVPAYALT